MKPTPRQNCLASLICVLRDKGTNLAGCQFINRALMNLCRSLQGVLTLLGTCWTLGVEDREFCDISDAESGAPGVCAPLQSENPGKGAPMASMLCTPSIFNYTGWTFARKSHFLLIFFFFVWTNYKISQGLAVQGCWQQEMQGRGGFGENPFLLHVLGTENLFWAGVHLLRDEWRENTWQGKEMWAHSLDVQRIIWAQAWK